MNYLPFFSIVIPTYNRPQRLVGCLKAIARLNYPRDRFEVIVVDDGSKNPLDSVIASYKQKLDLRLVKQLNAGAATARNRGAANAKYEFLAFTDDDCHPTPNWLNILAECLAFQSDCIVGGHTVNALTDNIYASASQTLIDYVYFKYNQSSEQASFFTSSNFALAKSSFDKMKGFDSTFGIASEDRDFCARWLINGGKMIYLPQAEIFHYHNLTLRSFWQQHFNYGRGAFHFYRRHNRSKKQIGTKQSLSYYLNLLVYPFSQASFTKAFLLTILFVVSQIATTIGLVRELKQS